eukprot:scaffold19629_cov147-Amphora_coffeaeformis.AAC.1
MWRNRLPTLFFGFLQLAAKETYSFQPSHYSFVSRGGSVKPIRRIHHEASELSAAFFDQLDQGDSAILDEFQATIPTDTSLTNNPSIPTFEVPEEDSSHHIPWWRYIVPSRLMLPELVAECFGTFILLQLAIGIVVSSVMTNSMEGIFPIAVLTGMAVTTSVSAVSSRCAAHFNPAISWAMCLYRGFGWHKFLPYFTSQLIGATLAALVNYLIFASPIQEFEALNGIVRSSMDGLGSAKAFACYFTKVTTDGAFISETFGAFALSSVVFALTSQKNTQAKGLPIPSVIGSTVALIISIIGPISAASLNPARELGPRLVLWAFGWTSTAFYQLPLYLLAPILGATLGGFFVDHILYSEPSFSTGLVEEEAIVAEV